jgi:hypothetical protein
MLSGESNSEESEDRCSESEGWRQAGVRVETRARLTEDDLHGKKL